MESAAEERVKAMDGMMHRVGFTIRRSTASVARI
jgi:hypothetical protein